jgi:hypothetical protein
MAKQRRQSNVHVSVYDFKDTDLMAHLAATSALGLTAAETAEAMGLNPEEGTRAVGMRFAWMKKYGMLSYDEKTKLWSLTNGAERVMTAQKTAAMTEVIERFPDESMVEVMANITSRYRLGDPMTAALLRREFVYGTARRSRAWGRRSPR